MALRTGGKIQATRQLGFIFPGDSRLSLVDSEI